MAIPSEFQFSQASLQDYSECRRRFYLRYLLRLAWPAVQIEPAAENERYLQQGQRFHRMIQQSLLGVPAERLAQMAGEADLHRWWGNFQSARERLPELEGLRQGTSRAYVETSLSGQVCSHTLVAVYDLVLVGADGSVVIFDWKTSRQRPKRPGLSRRLQTRVYPYLLVQAGAHLNQGKPFCPEQVQMIYWFAEHPGQPERFPYSLEQYQADEAYLCGLIAEIERLPESEFTLTAQVERCHFCVYRSLCERGVSAGALSETQEDTEAALQEGLDFDFEQIGEIGF
jgi:CRISPR/Cas system-associated exonuclease Cas4 (RecB family)